MSHHDKPEIYEVEDENDVNGETDLKHDSALHGEPTVQPTLGLEVPNDKRTLHRRLNLKLDLCVIPPLVFCYLMTSLDRNNVGNAQTVNFLGDLGIEASALNTASTIFFALLAPMYPISTYLGKRFGVMKWIPANVFIWGFFSLLHAFMKTKAQFYAFRAMVAICEAGFYPCAAYYLSSCYTRYDLGLRLGLLYGAYSIAGSFGSLIAYGMLRIHGSLYGWQFLFLIEGLFTMVLGIFVYFWVPSRLDGAWFLNREEREWAVERMRLDSGGMDYQQAGITKDAFIRTCKDWKWIMVWPGQFVAGLTTSAFTTFIPIIVQQLGYAGVSANLYSVPIYVAATGGLLIFLLSSDHFRERSIHNLVAVLFTIIGLIITCTVENPHGRYAGLVILEFGAFATGPLTVAILANNTPEPGQRALVLSTHSMGIFNGIVASQLFSPKYAPRYKIPFYVCLAGSSFSFLSFVAYYFTFKLVNRRRAERVARMTPEEIAWENSDECPRKYEWKYTFQFGF